MRRHSRPAGAVALALLCGIAVLLAVIAPPARSASAFACTIVTSWPWVAPYGCFAEGMTLGADGNLFWRTSLTTNMTLTMPWFQDARLAPSGGGDIGANGIASKGDSLFVSVFSPGRIVMVQVKADGSPGTVTVPAESNMLRSSDGIAFDTIGNLWITRNYGGSGGLLVLTSAGRLKVVVEQASWLDYPTTPVFAPTINGVGKVYIENGGYVTGLPNVAAISGLLP